MRAATRLAAREFRGGTGCDTRHFRADLTRPVAEGPRAVIGSLFDSDTGLKSSTDPQSSSARSIRCRAAETDREASSSHDRSLRTPEHSTEQSPGLVLFLFGVTDSVEESVELLV